MEQDTDADLGGEDLSVEQATAAYMKANEEGADKGQPNPDELDEADNEADDEEASDDLDEDESEGEPEDEEGQPEDEDEDEPESEKGRFVAANGRVKLPDGSVATVDDLIKGNLRDRDYRQKTMTLAEEARVYKEQSSKVQASMQELEQQREYVTSLMQSIIPQPPSTSLLDSNSPDYDPIGYTEQKAIHDNFLAHNQYLHQQSEAVWQQAEAEKKAAIGKKQNAEWEALLDAAPELRDQAKLASFSKVIQSTGSKYGFSPQEIAETLPNDHRMALVLRDAAKWRKLQESKPKATEKMQGRPPIQRSGKRLSSGAQKARRSTDAFSRLKETGSVEDAAAAFIASQKG
jgi:hypothetical protein